MDNVHDNEEYVHNTQQLGPTWSFITLPDL